MGIFGPTKSSVKAVVNIVDNKKTYLIVFLALALGAIDGLGIFNIPDWMFEILPFLGLGTLRHAIKKAKEAAQDAAKAAEHIKIINVENERD